MRVWWWDGFIIIRTEGDSIVRRTLFRDLVWVFFELRYSNFYVFLEDVFFRICGVVLVFYFGFAFFFSVRGFSFCVGFSWGGRL